MDQKTEYDPKTDEITIKSYNEPVNGFLIATCDIEAVIPLGAIRYNGEGYHDTECLSYEIPGKKYERYEGLGMHDDIQDLSHLRLSSNLCLHIAR